MTKDQQGTSLTELLLVIVVLGSIVFLLGNLPSAVGLMNKSKHLSQAREVASKQIEDKRATSYTSLVNNQAAITDSRLTLLPQGAGTITVEDCNPQVCTNAEHTKQITSQVSWRDNNKLQTVTLKTLISEGGLNK